TGSSGSNFFNSLVNSTAASQSTCFLCNRPKCFETLATCTSTGQINCAGVIFFHKPNQLLYYHCESSTANTYSISYKRNFLLEMRRVFLFFQEYLLRKKNIDRSNSVPFQLH